MFKPAYVILQAHLISPSFISVCLCYCVGFGLIGSVVRSLFTLLAASLHHIEGKWVSVQVLSPIPSVGRSVGLSVRCIVENGLLYPDAFWDDHDGSARSKDEASRRGWRSPHGKGQFWGGYGASHYNQWRLCYVVV